jgi:hypothetical protein
MLASKSITESLELQYAQKGKEFGELLMTEVVAVIIEPDTAHMRDVVEAASGPIGLIGVEVPR